MKRGYAYEWFPFYRGKWLWGSTRHELDPAERSVFVDLLCIAGNDDGLIQANPDTPYPHTQLAGMLCVPIEVLESTIQKCLDPKIGKLIETKPGIYLVTNWSVYSLSTSYRKAVGPKKPVIEKPKIEFERERFVFIGIEPADMKAWGEAFPACDLGLEIKRMIEWIRSNPAKGRKSNWRKFITNWLTRTQDRGGTKREGGFRSSPPAPSLDGWAERKAREEEEKKGRSK